MGGEWNGMRWMGIENRSLGVWIIIWDEWGIKCDELVDNKKCLWKLMGWMQRWEEMIWKMRKDDWEGEKGWIGGGNTIDKWEDEKSWLGGNRINWMMRRDVC